ncbi:DDHD domain [Trinorchestia longiramus]|nr:DDHD domain [Trinorchestia longiramus]
MAASRENGHNSMAKGTYDVAYSDVNTYMNSNARHSVESRVFGTHSRSFSPTREPNTSRSRSPRKHSSHSRISSETRHAKSKSRSSHVSNINARYLDSPLGESDDIRLESLSNRISNLKLQCRGILASSPYPEMDAYSAYYRDQLGMAPPLSPSPSLVKYEDELRMHSSRTPLSLPLNRSSYSFDHTLSSNKTLHTFPYTSFDELSGFGNHDELGLPPHGYGHDLVPSPAPSNASTIKASENLNFPSASSDNYISSKEKHAHISRRSAPDRQNVESKINDKHSNFCATKVESLHASPNIDKNALAEKIHSDELHESTRHPSRQDQPANVFKLNYDEGSCNFMSKKSSSALEINHESSSLPAESLISKTSISTTSSLDNLLDTGPGSFGSLGSHISPYFKEFVEDLGPEEYRWFYKAESDKKWIPFIGYDSLRIEWKFRDLQQNGLAGAPMIATTEPGTENGSASGNEIDERPFELGEEGTVTVRGGLYEVNVKFRKGQSIYWKGEVFVICRGTWFYEGAWAPLDEVLAEKLEREHLTYFRGQPLNVPGVADSQKQVVRRLSVPEGSVEWFNASEVYLSLDATPARLMRSVGKKLGFQKTGYKVHRGYSCDACASDKLPDITHLVFVIHGIGQKMDTGRIIRNSTSLRDNVNTLKQRYLKEQTTQAGGDAVDQQTTVEFFPVEWRSLLTLDNGLIDSITPHKIINIRQMLNASFMDIMYYNSPQYREEIVNVLSSELNRLYSLFTERNRYFEANGGKVSVVSHSLGCVITYDIVTGWSPTPQLSTSFLQAMVGNGVLAQQQRSSDNSMQLQLALQQLLQQQQRQAQQPNLNFKIENFFCLGSPLAVFLALRWKKDAGAPPLQSRDSFKRILNIFHPSDPVAYRLEPLVIPSYGSVAPVTLHCHSTAEKLPYHQMNLEPAVSSAGVSSTAVSATVKDSAADTRDTATPGSSQPTTPVKGGSSSWNLWGLMKGSKKSSETSASAASSGAWNSDSLLTNFTGLHSTESYYLSQGQRIDHVLREGSMESSYISALTSHTSYWSNYDVAHFLLTVLYPHLQTCSTSAASNPSTAGSTTSVSTVSIASGGLGVSTGFNSGLAISPGPMVSGLGATNMAGGLAISPNPMSGGLGLPSTMGSGLAVSPTPMGSHLLAVSPIPVGPGTLTPSPTPRIGVSVSFSGGHCSTSKGLNIAPSSFGTSSSGLGTTSNGLRTASVSPCHSSANGVRVTVGSRDIVATSGSNVRGETSLSFGSSAAGNITKTSGTVDSTTSVSGTALSSSRYTSNSTSQANHLVSSKEILQSTTGDYLASRSMLRNTSSAASVTTSSLSSSSNTNVRVSTAASTGSSHHSVTAGQWSTASGLHLESEKIPESHRTTSGVSSALMNTTNTNSSEPGPSSSVASTHSGTLSSGRSAVPLISGAIQNGNNNTVSGTTTTSTGISSTHSTSACTDNSHIGSVTASSTSMSLSGTGMSSSAGYVSSHMTNANVGMQPRADAANMAMRNSLPPSAGSLPISTVSFNVSNTGTSNIGAVSGSNLSVSVGSTGFAITNSGMSMSNQVMPLNNSEFTRAGLSMGDTGMSMGNTGMSMGNTGMSMGNMGMSMGNTGISMGNIGMSMSSTGMPMNNSSYAPGSAPSLAPYSSVSSSQIQHMGSTGDSFESTFSTPGLSGGLLSSMQQLGEGDSYAQQRFMSSSGDLIQQFMSDGGGGGRQYSSGGGAETYFSFNSAGTYGGR